MDNDQTRLPDEGPKASLLSPGQAFGQYKVIRLLGRGGMGEVYEVENPVIGQRFALKLVNREILERTKALERFQQEARVMSGFDHPNIVKVDDYGETEGQRWLRMQLIGGGERRAGSVGQGAEGEASGGSSLADLLKGEPLPEALVVDLLKQILDGLAYAHSKGAIHRDIKPSNILIDGGWKMANGGASADSPSAIRHSSSSPTAKITDFGLVHMAGEDWLQSRVQLTVAQSMTQSADPDRTHLEGGSGSSQGSSAQALLGTFEFMAPEQKQGKPADARSDLYAVGLMAFRMLTGESVPGFKGPSRINPELSPAWDAWIERAMESRPEARYASAEAMAQALPDGKPSMADGGSMMADGPKSKKGLWLGFGALLVAGVVLGLGYVMRDTGSVMPDAGGSASDDLTATSTELSPGERGEEEQFVDVAEDLPPESIKPGGAIIKTDPPGATVRVGDLPEQRTPAVFEALEPGEQRVRIELAGYDPLSVALEVSAGEYAQPPVYPLRRSTGSLMLRSDPPGATVFLDSRELGTAPLSEGSLPVGEYRLRAEWAKFFEPVQRPVRIVRDEKSEILVLHGFRL